MAETVFVASFQHESQTFTDEMTGRDDFASQQDLYGEAVPDTLQGTNSEIGGLIEVAEAEGVQLEFSIAVSAEPGGPVERATYEHYVGRIAGAIGEEPDEINGVILPLHGAMVPEHLDDGEGPLVRMVRDTVGDSTPIVVTIDPNANVAPGLFEHADAIVAYEETPHVDMGETGRTGMQLLVRAMHGEIDPIMHIERPPVIPSAVKSTTLEPPMTDIHARARQLETRDAVLKANVCQGFWSADVPHMGFSIIAVADGRPMIAQDVARELAELVWDRREEFVEATHSVGPGVATAKERIEAKDAEAGPVVIAEMHDNPGGGSSADGTRLLREFINQALTNAGFAIMCDPEAVQACVAAGVGRRVEIDLGGKRGDATVDSEPLRDLEGYIKAITDGRYYNTGPMLHGVENNLGRTVRFQCGTEDGIDVILTENRIQPWDAEIFRHVGVAPERLDLIGLKSAVHYRADYGPIASDLISIDESPPREYERISRPKYPLDPMDTDDYPDWT